MSRCLSRSICNSSTSTTTSALALSLASMIFSAMRTLSAVSRMVMALSAFSGKTLRASIIVRTMIEARNVFPLKALNAITIRDTADKVRIAEKIIEANDKAKAEVVVDVELLQLDLDKTRDIGFVINGYGSTSPGVLQPLAPATGTAGGNVPLTQGTLADLRRLNSGLISFSIPNASYAALKSIGNTQLLANPELRISEGEKATLHIGSRIPVPVST